MPPAASTAPRKRLAVSAEAGGGGKAGGGGGGRGGGRRGKGGGKRPRSAAAIAAIEAASLECFMLQALPAEELRDLMSQMFEVEAQPDQVLIAEGDVDADNFYIVQVRVRVRVRVRVSG